MYNIDTFATGPKFMLRHFEIINEGLLAMLANLQKGLQKYQSTHET